MSSLGGRSRWATVSDLPLSEPQVGAAGVKFSADLRACLGGAVAY